jgi:hypothetical protein
VDWRSYICWAPVCVHSHFAIRTPSVSPWAKFHSRLTYRIVSIARRVPCISAIVFHTAGNAARCPLPCGPTVHEQDDHQRGMKMFIGFKPPRLPSPVPVTVRAGRVRKDGVRDVGTGRERVKNNVILVSTCCCCCCC